MRPWIPPAVGLAALAASGMAAPRPAVAAPPAAAADPFGRTGSATAPGRSAPRRRMVAVVRTTGAGAAAEELATRIIAELMAGNVAIMTIGCASIDTACLGMVGANAPATLLATVLIFPQNQLPAVEVRGPGREGRQQRVQVGSVLAASPTALAVRTVEVLRAMSLEPDEEVARAPGPASAPTPPAGAAALGLASFDPTGPPPPPRVNPRPAPPPAIQRTGDDDERDDDDTKPPELAPVLESRAALRVGATVLGSTGGLAPSYGAAAALIRPLARSLQISLSLAGTALGGREQNFAGDAAVQQALALVQVGLRGALGRRVPVAAGLGMGVHYLHVEGHTSPDFGAVGSPASEGHFSPAFGGSASIAAQLRDDLALFLEGQAFFLTRVPVVLINGVEVGKTGAPGLALAAGVEFRL